MAGKNYDLCKKKSKFAKFGTKSTFFKVHLVSLNLDALVKFFQNALRVYINISVYVDFKRTLKKKYTRNKTSGTLFSFDT